MLSFTLEVESISASSGVMSGCSTALEVVEHPLGELARRVDPAHASALVEAPSRPVVEIFAVRLLAGGVDPHGRFCTSDPNKR